MRWPGSERESALYELQPGAGAEGATSQGPGARTREVESAPARPLPRSLAALTWPEIESLLAAGCRTAVIPLGAIEQHGPHLPLDTDARIADALAERFCAAVPEALRLPALWPGCSREHLGFPGTLDLRASTLEALLVDVAGSLARHGFDRLFVFSAHGGNDAALRALLPALRAAATPARVIAFTGVERIAAAQARASAVEGVAAGACGHHAGEHETSILLGLSPSVVRAERLEPGVTEVGEDAQALFYPDLRQRAPNGVVGDPREASGRRAEAYLTAWADALVSSYRAEKNAK
jgi:creatinine amidohydrolase